MRHWWLSLTLLFVSRLAWGGAHEEPRYSLEGRTIVVEHDGFRETFDIDCDDIREMKHREGRLLVACGGSGIATYSLENPLEPRFIGRKPTRGGPCVGIAADDSCIVKTEVIRSAFEARAPREVVRLTACNLGGTTSIDGRVRTLDISVDGKRCSKGAVPEDPFSVDVRLIELDEGVVRVVVEHAPTDVVDDEIREALSAVSDEIESRVPRSLTAVKQYLDQKEKPAKRTWYGWQIIILDASGLTSCATIVLCPVGLGLFVFAPPIIHWVHGHSERGWISLLIRGGPALVGMGIGTLVGFGISCNNFRGCGTNGTTETGTGVGAAIGGITSAVSAPIVDPIIAYDEPKGVALVPIVTPGFVGVGGTF